jgi:hypothetical protein
MKSPAESPPRQGSAFQGAIHIRKRFLEFVAAGRQVRLRAVKRQVGEKTVADYRRLRAPYVVCTPATLTSDSRLSARC